MTDVATALKWARDFGVGPDSPAQVLADALETAQAERDAASDALDAAEEKWEEALRYALKWRALADRHEERRWWLLERMRNMKRERLAVVRERDAAEAQMFRTRDKWHDALRERDAALAENAALREAIRLALAGLPDPMHPEIPRQFVDRLVSAQIVLADASGDDDAGDVAAARSALAAVPAERDAALDALREYGEHHDDCPASWRTHGLYARPACTCGLSALLAGSEPTEANT